MDVPPPTQLIRQTNEHRPPELSPEQAAVISAEQWGYHWAHEKRMELKARDDVKDSWLYRKTAQMDAKSVAILRKGYADMFECENPQWKVNMDNYITKARELEKQSKDNDGKDKDDA